MLFDEMRTMVDLVHRDDPQVEDRVVNELRTDEQILQSQEQLKKEYDDDDQI
jgi:anion-transporting  ArsA/GET3 family ATPase